MKNSKYVNFLFIAGAALIWLGARHYTDIIIGQLQLARRFGPNATDFLLHAVPIFLGIATFVFLRRWQKGRDFTQDAVGELAAVTWPSQRETRFGTLIVIVTILIAGVVLGVIDLGFTKIVQVLIGA